MGQKLWKKDLPGTYQALAAYNWTEPVANIIRALEGKYYSPSELNCKEIPFLSRLNTLKKNLSI